MIGKIDRRPIREVFEREDSFTKWLEENVNVLNDVLDLSLVSAEREQAAGDFSVDLIAEDENTGNTVIIENQIEKSNHDHLGKVLTYLSNLEAKVAIWIVSDPRSEHIKAVSWLNESRLAEFYLVKLEVVRINNSDAAPLFTLIVGPSEVSRIIGDQKEENEERHDLRYKFWSMLLDNAKGKTKLHTGISPSQYSWIGTGAGKGGLAFNYVARQHDAQAELYINRGKDSEKANKAIYDQLFSHKKEIEELFGESLNWERLDNGQACRISKAINTGGYRDDESKWPAIHDQLIDAMIRLEKAFKPFIAKLDI